MAFKKFANYLEQKQGKFFVLRNDGDFADVVFLYKSYDDMMVVDAHYITSSTFSGYAECCTEEYGQCPACSYGNRGIQKQSKLFIPLFNLTKGTLEFWDRNTTFETHFNESVFKPYPNPSEYVFRITRHGQARDRGTTYEITAIGTNSTYPMDKILADWNTSFPEGYAEVCKSMTPTEMANTLNNHGSQSDLADYTYTPVPRGTAVQSEAAESIPEPPDINVDLPTYSAPPTDLPDIPVAPVTGVTDNPPQSVPELNESAPEDPDASDDLDTIDF